MRLLLAGTVAALTSAILAATRPAVITPEEASAGATIRANRLRADIRFLSSDLLEGRAPGSRGDSLAREYVASRFEAIGLEPAAPRGSWYQPVDLVGVTSVCPSAVSAEAGTGDGAARVPRRLRRILRGAVAAGAGRRGGRVRRLRHRRA